MNKDNIIKILKYVGLILLSIIALFTIYYVLTNRIFKRINPNYKPLISVYTIVSESMKPKLNIYDLAIDIKVSKDNDIKKGDIITFKTISNSQTITHRVIDIIETEDGKLYKTKGDNNNEADEDLITIDNIIGKYLFKIPKIGRLGFKV